MVANITVGCTRAVQAMKCWECLQTRLLAGGLTNPQVVSDSQLSGVSLGLSYSGHYNIGRLICTRLSVNPHAIWLTGWYTIGRWPSYPACIP